MGLSSWIQKLLARSQSAAKARSPREDFVQLYLNRLEDRRVLNADFALMDGTLTLSGFETADSLTIRENTDTGNFEFILNGETWSGTDVGTDIVGNGSNTLTVNSNLVNLDGDPNDINSIQIQDDVGIDLDVSFADNTYLTANFSSLDGAFGLQDVGNVTQFGGSTLQISMLGVTGADSLVLNEANNDFGEISALEVAGVASLQDANDLTLGNVTTGSLFQVTTAGVMTLNGNISTDFGTDAGNVALNGNVRLGNSITIDSDATGMDGSVNINGTIDSTDGTQSLTVQSGDGSTTITDTVGTTALSSLSINTAANGGGSGAISVNNIGTGTAGVTGVTEIGNNTGSSLILTGTNYRTDGIQTYHVAAGQEILVTAGSDVAVISSDDTITLGDSAIASAVRLTNGANLTVNSGNGNISINTVRADNLDLSLNAGTGTVTSHGSLGVVGLELHDLTITASTLNLGGDIRTRARDEAGTDTPGNVLLTATTINVTQSITIDTTINEDDNVADGSLTVNGPINADGQTLIINIGTNDLTLTNAANNFGTLGITANSASITDANSLILSNITLDTGFVLNLGLGESTQASGTSISGNTGLDLATLGILTVSQPNTYNGTTTVLNGELRLAGNGAIVGPVVVNSGTTLSGSGSLSGTVQISGNLSPGTSPGLLTIGNLTFNDDSDFTAEIIDTNNNGAAPGVEYDQAQVTGNVIIGANVILNLSAMGSTQIEGGEVYTLIRNDGINPISGMFANFAEGADVTALLGLNPADYTATLSYMGGNGNDLTISVTGPTAFDAPPGGGTLRLLRNDQGTPGDATDDTLEYYIDNVLTDSVLLSGVTEITVNGNDASDETLIIDFSGGIITPPITFNGGEDTVDNDTLIITGGSFGQVIHNFDVANPGVVDPNSGNLVFDIDGDTINTTDDQATITYTGLEPVDTTGSTIADLVLNLPAGVTDAVLEDDGTLANGTSQIRSISGAFETAMFANPTNSLTVNLGNGNETLTVAALPDFIASLTINGQDGDDTVNFTGNFTLGSATHPGNLMVTAETINLQNNATLRTVNGTTGDVNLTGDNITMNDGTTIETNTGNITINATGNVALSRLVTNNTTVSITAGGAITDNTAAEGAGSENIVAGTITLSADTGIGSNGGTLGEDADIDIAGGTLTATNTSSGAIQIFETDSIALGLINNAGRTVVLDAGNAITDADTANEGAGSENIIADVIRLRATTGIGASGAPMIGDGEDIDINGGTLFAQNTTSGAIQIFEVDSIALDQVLNTGRTVLIDARNGSITDGSGTETANIIAGSAGLVAMSGIGSGVAGDATDIDTDVVTIAAITVTGDISFDETNALVIGAVGGVSGLTITNDTDNDTVVIGDPDDNTTGEDDIIVTAGGTLTVTNAVTNNDGGEIILTAEGANSLLVNADVVVNNLEQIALLDLDPQDGSITLSGQNVTLNSTGIATPTVQVSGPAASVFTSTTPRNGNVVATGIITINAGATTTINANSTLRSVGRVIQITTDDLVIDPAGSVTTGTPADNGVVIIRNATAGRTIQLGGAGAGLNISNAELQRINSNSLRIGRQDGVANAGDISLTGTFSANSVNITTLQLFTGANVTQTVGSALIADEISIFAGGNVDLNNAANDARQRLAITAGGRVQFNDVNALTIDGIEDQVDTATNAGGMPVGEGGHRQVRSVGSFVDLRAGGNLTVRNSVTTMPETGTNSEISAGGVNPGNQVAINLWAMSPEAFITIDSGANVFSTAGAHRYTADNMDIQGTIEATGVAVNLRNSTNNVAIDLGAVADGTVSTLELSDAELDRIATSLLAIGRNTNGIASGNIVFTQTIDPLLTNTLHLITAGTVTDAGGAVLETSLFVEAAGGATLDNIAANDVTTLAALVTGDGAAFTFRDVNSFNVGAVNRLTVTDDANESVGTAMTPPGIDTDGGNILLESNIGVNVNSPINSTADTLGRDSGSITIRVLNPGAINVNALIDSSGTTTGGNGEGGDITLETSDGNIVIAAAGSINALGGASAVDGGNITLTAGGSGSITIDAPVTTNDINDGTVRGSIALSAGDTVTLNAALSTTNAADDGLGTVTVTANTSTADGAGDGAIVMNAGSSITADNGMVLLQTTEDNNAAVDNASITVRTITTNNGSIAINANDQNADVLLQGTITTADGTVTVEADDSVQFAAAGMILVSGAGNIAVRANAVNTDGDGNDEILMANGSLISANTGTLTLRTDGANGGDITIGQLVTQNSTAAAVTINARMAVLDTNDGGAVDIQALQAGAVINITAMTGVGTAGMMANPLETSGVRFNVNNTGAGPIDIANTVDNLDVVIDRLTTMGQQIQFINSDTDGLTPGLLTINGTGVASASNGGVANDIIITTQGELTVAAPLNTQGGTGGAFTMTGGVTFAPGAAILLGSGDIMLMSGGVDILINADLTIDGGPARFFAPQDIIVAARLLTRVDNGSGTFVDATVSAVDPSAPINADIQLSADSDNNGVGGVLVRGIGEVVASGDLLIEGSDLVADGLLATALPAGIQNGVHVERDTPLPEETQIRASGNSGSGTPSLILRNRGLADSNIVLGGILGTQTPNLGRTNLQILIDATENIILADNTTLFTPNGVTTGDPLVPMIAFGDVAGRDPVIDDGIIGTPSNLTVNSSGTVVFFGRVGDAPADPDGMPGVMATPTSERISSLTTNAGGQTHIRGGFVSTVGSQFYGDDVLIHADTPLVNSTSFTTTAGDATFSGIVQGLDLDPANDGTPILDDLTLNVAGTTTFAGIVGVDPLNPGDDARRIGDGMVNVGGNGRGYSITINSTGQTFFNNAVFTEAGIFQSELAGTVTFRAPVFIDQGATADNGMFPDQTFGARDANGVNGNIDSIFLADVTLDSATIYSNGNMTFGSGNVNEDVLFISNSSVIDTAGRDFNDPARTTMISNLIPSRNITLNSRVSDPVATLLQPNQDLTLNLHMGDLLIAGSVGNSPADNRFGDLIVQSVNDFVFGPFGTQLILAESLVQLSGVDTANLPMDDGRPNTIFSSAIDVNGPTGLQIATTDVIFNSSVDTNGQRALTQAQGNIFYTDNSSLTTEGGMVVSEAINGTIMMEEANGLAATIDALGGTVVLQAGGNLMVSQIRSANGLVSLGSGMGQVIDAGDEFALGSTNDIQAARLRIMAATGIGFSGNGTLETQVSNLEAANGTDGISIVNTGDLTIGGLSDVVVNTFRQDLGQAMQMQREIEVRNLDGVSTQNGNLNITTIGSMTVAEDIVNAGVNSTDGNINLVALGPAGNFVITQTVDPIDTDTPNVTNIQADNGSVTLVVGNNFLSGGSTVMSSNAGNVFVTTGGTTTFGGHVRATNNGNVLVDSTGDFTLINNTMPNPNPIEQNEIYVEGVGQIIVSSDGRIIFDQNSGAQVRSATGLLRAVDRSDVPLLRGILAPPINTSGEAVITFTIGVPGETGFYAIVDWGDGVAEVLRVDDNGVPLDAGQHTLRHTYNGPPNPNNPSAPIPIVLAIATDPSIHFFGTNNVLAADNSVIPPELRALRPAQPLVVPSSPIDIGRLLDPDDTPLLVSQFINRALNPLDRFSNSQPFADMIDSLDVVTEFPIFEVPVNGFGDVAFEIDQEEPPFFIPGETAQFLRNESDEFLEEGEDLEFSGGGPEEQAEDEVVVKLRVLSPSGQKLYEYQIDAVFLSNPTPLWNRLPDGRYQIVIEEPGRSIPIIVRDVELKEHKVIRRFDRTRRGPNEESSQLQSPAADAALSMQLPLTPEQQAAGDVLQVPAEAEAGPDRIWENWRRASTARRFLATPTESEQEAPSDAPAVAASVAGTLALGTLSRRSSEDADSQMLRFSKRALSPAARLRRRLRK